MADEEARRWVVVGQVQGVGYRYFTRQTAQALGIRGWVRNLPEGMVEVQAAGPTERLEAFRAELLRGPRGARVEDVEEERLVQVPNWKGFEVVF
jgi:acylphosphatase